VAIYHIKVSPNGVFEISLEMHYGRQKEFTIPWIGHGEEALRSEVQNLSELARETRKNRKTNTLAYVSRGRDKKEWQTPTTS